MILKHKLTSKEYEAIVFDGENFPAEKTITKESHEIIEEYHTDVVVYQVELDSPSGDKVLVDLALGSYLLTCPNGKAVACHEDLIAKEYKEVT